MWRVYLLDSIDYVEIKGLKAALFREKGYFWAHSPPPEFLGRDSANIVVAEVASTEAMQESWGVQCFMLFRLKERLKRATFWKDGGQTESGTPCAQAAVGGADSGKPLTVGKDVILAFDTPYGVMSQRFIDLNPNAIFPLTDENLAAVRRGIGMDIFPDASVHFP